MIEIENKTISVTYIGTYDEITVNGNYNLNPDNVLINISGSLNKNSEYIGAFDVYLNGEDLTVNKSGIKFEDMEIVDPIVTQCIAEIQTLITK